MQFVFPEELKERGYTLEYLLHKFSSTYYLKHDRYYVLTCHLKDDEYIDFGAIADIFNFDASSGQELLMAHKRASKEQLEAIYQE